MFGPTNEYRLYRYRLWRRWGDGALVVFLMLNPSTADEFKLDPTLRRVRGFARSWGYAGFEIVNLFAWRSTDPKILPKIEDPIGPDNDRHILETCTPDRTVVAAWGKNGRIRNRGAEVRAMLERAGVRLYVLRTLDDGSPEHPLYLPAALSASPWPTTVRHEIS